MTSNPKRGRPARPRYKPWNGMQRQWVDLAMRRTEYLIQPHPLSVQPLRMALANAYLQGVADTGEALQDRGRTKPNGRENAVPEGLG